MLQYTHYYQSDNKEYYDLRTIRISERIIRHFNKTT